MIKIKIKELLEKNKISRYKLRQYTNFTYERINQYYFGTIKSIKVEELEILCQILKCNIADIIEYSKNSKKSAK